MAGPGPRRVDLTDEQGSALIEFVVLGLVAQLLLLGVSVPLLVRQQHQIAAISAAKLVGRATAAGQPMSAGYSESVSRVVASNFGVEPSQVRISVVRLGGGLASVSASVAEVGFSYKVRVPR